MKNSILLYLFILILLLVLVINFLFKKENFQDKCIIKTCKCHISRDEYKLEDNDDSGNLTKCIKFIYNYYPKPGKDQDHENFIRFSDTTIPNNLNTNKIDDIKNLENLYKNFINTPFECCIDKNNLKDMYYAFTTCKNIINKYSENMMTLDNKLNEDNKQNYSMYYKDEDEDENNHSLELNPEQKKRRLNNFIKKHYIDNIVCGINSYVNNHYTIFDTTMFNNLCKKYTFILYNQYIKNTPIYVVPKKNIDIYKDDWKEINTGDGFGKPPNDIDNIINCDLRTYQNKDNATISISDFIYEEYTPICNIIIENFTVTNFKKIEYTFFDNGNRKLPSFFYYNENDNEYIFYTTELDAFIEYYLGKYHSIFPDKDKIKEYQKFKCHELSVTEKKNYVKGKSELKEIHNNSESIIDLTNNIISNNIFINKYRKHIGETDKATEDEEFILITYTPNVLKIKIDDNNITHNLYKYDIKKKIYKIE